MKTYTVTNEGGFKGLAVTRKPYPHVQVGQDEYGGTCTRVPLNLKGPRSLLLTNEPLEVCSVFRTSGGTIVLAREQKPDNRALVLIDIDGGHDDETIWTAVTYDLVPCPNRGLPAGGFICRLCGEAYPAHARGVWEDEAVASNIHPVEGMKKDWHDFPPEGILVLAEGVIRPWGPAGHMVRLIIMQPGSALRVLRLGLSRNCLNDVDVVLHWDGETLKCGSWAQVFPPGEESLEDAELL